MNNYWQVEWLVDEPENIEQIASDLGIFFNVGVEIVENISRKRMQNERFGELFDTTISIQPKICIYIPRSESKSAIHQHFVARFGTERTATNLSIQPYTLPDYEQAWKDSIKDIQLGNLTIVPPWRFDLAQSTGKIVLEPKMAFGTGTHETTQLVATLLSQLLLDNQSVIDVGTGSGILALYCAKNGAKRVLGIELDNDAVIEAQANVQMNALSQVEIQLSDGLHEITETFDLLIANMTTPILKIIIPDVAQVTAQLIFSGILVEEYVEIKQLLETFHWQITQQKRIGQWVALHAVFA